MLIIVYTNYCGLLSPAILAQFTLEMRVAAQNLEKFTKTSYFGDQSHSRSSMLTFPRSLSPVIVMMSNMYVSICNHFNVRRANSGRKTPLKEKCPYFAPSFVGTPSPRGMKFRLEILKTLSYHMAKTQSLYIS